MPFVKLDCGILNSTLWFEREAREVFITALLMAEPVELTEEAPQIAVGSLDYTGWNVPPGWYGFVPAASVGILHRAQVPPEVGLEALRRLGDPEDASRSKDFEGRRLVRVDGGFIVLNFMKYRERDYTSAERSRRYREKKASQRGTVTSRRDITQAEAEAEAEVQLTKERKSTRSDLPHDQRAEKAISANRVRLERELLSLSSKIAELEDEDPPKIIRQLTSYKRADGGNVVGRVNPALLSFERLEKSVEDGRGWLSELEAEKK